MPQQSTTPRGWLTTFPRSPRLLRLILVLGIVLTSGRAHAAHHRKQPQDQQHQHGPATASVGPPFRSSAPGPTTTTTAAAGATASTGSTRAPGGVSPRDEELLRRQFVFTSEAYNASIAENSVGKSLVLPTERMGISLPRRRFEELRYRIVAGDKDKFFKAEERTVGDFCFLVIRTRTGNIDVLNRELQDSYTLEVRATAVVREATNRQNSQLLQLEAETRVRVGILDTNDLNPLFYPTEYEATVGEDVPVHRSVLRVHAEDADLGVNGEIYYSFAERTEQFAIHPVTGVITLARPLRYHDVRLHELEVLARDRGALYRRSPQVSSARVTIHVKQVNLHEPEITVHHLPEILERTHVDIYAVVNVIDRDPGIHGQIASLDIISGDPDGYFRVEKSPDEPDEYQIQVFHLLERESVPQSFNLTFRATDRGSPPRSAFKSVLVHLADVNDNSPIFSREVYEVRVVETAPINTPIIRLKVSENTEGQRSSLVFLEIVGGNEGGAFYINADTGMLYTAITLDAEKKAFYTLTVSAVDQGNSGNRAQSSAKVKIYVVDTNDNDPEFELTDLMVDLNENEPAGTSVTKVVAKDRDSGENAYISYSIDNIRRVPFEIDPFSGIVRTRQVIDYETMKREYILYVRASDWGLPYRRQSEMQIKITIRDVNDNRPQFTKIDCIGHVLKHLPPGTEILTVSAIDFDSGSTISYRIVSGNSDGCFALDSASGVLAIACDLSDLNTNERVINVTATDGTHFADVNSITLFLENKTRKYEGNSKFGEYGVFDCQDTGVARKGIDIEAAAEKNNSPVEEEVHAMLSSRYGENLRAPEFIDFPTQIRVNESAPVGYVLAILKAQDRDRGYNGKLVYGISGGDSDSVFGIQLESGELRVINRLDRERESEYFLNITVYDLGKPQKFNSKMLPITVLDVNDNPPRFERSLVKCHLFENVPNGTVVFQARATDADLGANAEIYYSIQTDTKDFRIDRKTGIITVAKGLDRERQETYELRVRATDKDGADAEGSSDPPLYSESLVKVVIKDVNDNAPKFDYPTYTIKVREDIPIWSVVTIIKASDPDKESGGEVSYSLHPEVDNEDFFEIDRLTGTIRTTKNLDFEERQVHSLTLVAQDSGEPSLSSTASLIVEVIDVNENFYPPVFSDFVVAARILENQQPGTLVTRVRAKDADPPGGDSKISYSITGGDGLGYFSIDNEGNIKTKSILDAESKDSYWLTITAQDHGLVPLGSKLEVYIQVIDVNDNVPLTELPVYYPSVMENSPAGVSVVRVTAFDRDVTSQELTYAITGGNPEGYFLINSTTGLITTSGRKLDRENQDEHILEVTVRDAGQPVTLSSTTRVVVQVDDVNDWGPEFDQKFYVVHVPASQPVDKPLFQKSEREQSRESDLSDVLLEGASWETYSNDELTGDYVFRVLAHDKDIGKNGRVKYSIKSGKGKGKFKIHPDSGMVFAQKPFEASQEFDMVIRASDEGDPPRSHQARISVQVTDVPLKSKHPPVFKTVNLTAVVTESDRVGFLVALMQATQIDGNMLWYNIVGGDPRNEFFIGRDNGNVLLAKQLDWEAQNQYNLNISVTDGIHETFTNLRVNVIDINDHRPVFSRSEYRVQISENVVHADGSILQLHAEDLDEDKRVFYLLHSVQDLNSLRIFNVDSLSGAISLNEPLDRETIQEHILTVMVKDQGTPAKRNYARVIMTVHDHNDHAPIFTSELIQAKVFETSALGTEVLQVIAIDYDYGDNAKITYSIVSGNVGNVFTIDPDLGIIRVSRELNINSAPEYILLVRAIDHGSPGLSSSIPVHILVTMADNAPPRFVQKPEDLAAEIYENQPSGTLVMSLQVRSTSSVIYEIAEGNVGEAFFINPSTGIITTQEPLDYETTKFYNLTINTTNLASASATCHVIIHVLDKNDNPPRFVRAEYAGHVSEGSPIGSLVFSLNDTTVPLVIKAEDADSESNALLQYEIMDEYSRKYFHIDSSTGAIRTVRPLDYETTAAFRFSVKVSDLGKPKLSSEAAAKVAIDIININDCPPEFVQSNYNASLLLPTWRGVYLTTVQATDPDNRSPTPGDNHHQAGAALKYDIIDGNGNRVFVIDSSSGRISVDNPESIADSYLLHVRASDGMYTSIVQVSVSVERSENSGLVFEKEAYYATVQENSTKISTVTVVNILGSSLNEHVVFSILNPIPEFAIGPTSGVVRTTGAKFDRESRDSYELVVSARSEDPVRRVAHTLLNVTVIDVNDNCPIFVNLPYYAVVSVDAQKGDVIMKIHAIDLDSGENGEVRYELKKGHGELFKVGRKSGEILLKQSLEGHNREYSLTVAAYDGGIVPCSVEAPINIKVIDRSMPVFDKQFYTESVPENIEIQSPLVVAIQARSPLNRKLIYSITKGNDLENFAVDFNTALESNNGPCSIYVVDELDYERQKQHELTIRATDSVSGVYAEVILSILVTDVNDCPPEFDREFYNVSVSESAIFGTTILRIAARDNDTGSNGDLRYAIEPDAEPGEQGTELFQIDPDDGTIFLKRSLDHEAAPEYHFTVVASDKGIPSLSSTAHVWINVLDMNDNPPQFEQSSFSCSLSEEAERGQFVTVIAASDPDRLDSHRLTYAIVSGNEQQTYGIDQATGIISLVNMQNFAEEKLTMLNVSVTDGVFTSFARVKIEILPANRHHPKFENPVTEAEALENEMPGKLIASLQATDADFGIYGELEYSIQSDLMREYFEIDGRTGVLVTKKTLDREKQRLYQVPIVATDGGGKSGFITLRVKVIDENDNAPASAFKEYRACIYGNLSVNSGFMKVKATDLDEGEAGRIDYFVLPPKNSKTKSIFDVNPSTGALQLRESAKASERQQFQFFVRARDNGRSSRHTDIPVSVYVMGPEESPPLFERMEYKFYLQESAPLGSQIVRLKIMNSANRTVFCRLLGSSSDFPFSIDPGTCEVTLTSPLDREMKDNHVIGVLAEVLDSKLTALTEITLHVLDDNDHAPEFESNPYEVVVAENVDQGTAILKVIAHDEDLGSNSEIRYSFASDIGNLANVFTIDAYSGWISTMVPLDKEKQAEYKFQVVATDNGQTKHFVRTSVHLKLKDYNDHSPAFKVGSEGYKASVKEDALPGTVVVELTTQDQDKDLETQINYYIVSGDPYCQFQIRSTGEVYVAKGLDRETIDHYDLKVVGTDGKFVFYTKVTVKISDVNDNPPYCMKYRYKEILSEGSHPGSYVLTVSAIDYDDGPNSKLRYYLTGDSNEKFILDKDTGVLKTIGQLDRETQTKYTLTAHVQDREKPSWECSSQLEIIVSDLNDNAPKFSTQAYTAMLPEDVEVGTLVAKVHATDNDIGINRKIKYSFIDSASGHFSISSDSGIVRLAKPLDRETKASYNVTIQATDQGTPQLASVASLIVIVQDINDNPPEFTNKIYYTRVPEVNAVGSEVIKVLATSKDTGVNADIYYSIVGGNDHRKFAIDRNTGVVSIAENLDYERAKEYLLTVQAVDGGEPPLANQAIVNITVIDNNDNPPIFGQPSYRGSIREDAKIGESVLTVLATDVDSEENNKVTYSIERGDRLKQFAINAITGEITVAAKLDREHIASYALEVHAHDNGVPIMSNFVIANIQILDANDNPPVFSTSNYTAILQEDKPIGHTVLKFNVTDADSEPNAAPYTFDFRSGNEEDAFIIAADGTLRTAAEFNSKVKDTHILNIRVFDNGSPPLYSDAWVTVKIIEESQYPPVITLLEVFINSYQDKYPGGTIGKVHASDKDEYDTLSYSLVPSSSPHGNSELFTIDKNDGTVVALPMLDVGEYRINVSVSDGKFKSFSMVKINVDLVSDEMLEKSVIVRFREVSTENFILKHRKSFIRTIRNAMNCRPKDITILSVQPSIDADINTIRQRSVRQTVLNDLDVLFAVKKTNSAEYYTSESVREALNQRVEELEASTNLVVEEIVRYKCTKGYCVYGECQDTIVLDSDRITVTSTDVISFVSPKHRHHTKCVCKEGYAGTHCEIVVNECAREPCPSGKNCVPDSSVQGYSCQCPEGLSGENCETDVTKCNNPDEGSCYTPRNPISFSGKSFARYRVDKPLMREFIEKEMSVSFRVRTVHPTGNLFYAAGKIDYNVLELVNGALQYKFDLGSGEGVVRVADISLNDGQWHAVHLERQSNTATLTVDGKHSAHGSAPGPNSFLDLHADDLFLGAEVKQHPSILGFEDVQRGFVGCLDDVRIAKIPIPLHMSGSSNALILKGFANVDFNCDSASLFAPPGVCGLQPCQNGGTCKELSQPNEIGGSEPAFQCHCHERFKGRTCEIDTDPCASSPCLYNGRCKAKPSGGFSCECIGMNLSGQRCEIGRYCNPNPCLHGGVCEEGDSGPVCKCQGFTGDRCEVDLDECETNNPCTNGGTCVNEIGTYKCLCPPLQNGLTCGNPAEYTTGIIVQHLKISWEHLIWIAIAIFVNIILIITFVSIRKFRSKRMRNAVKNINNETRKKMILNSAKDNEIKRTSKLSNLEVVQREPPQCPPRPASYTPSSNNEAMFSTCNYATSNTAAIALNNLDTLRSYGSAGDELENVPADYLKNLNRCMPVPTTGSGITMTNTFSDNDNLRKSTWQEHMQLATLIAEGQKINNDLKRMNSNFSELNSVPHKINTVRSNPSGTSIASLSSMEEDPRIVGGYHWDCSDWVRPSQNPLPNITEVPGSEVPDSSSFHSNESNESNTHQNHTMNHVMNGPTHEIETLNEEQESEYIGDSEYTGDLSDHGVSQPFLSVQQLNSFETSRDLDYKPNRSMSYFKPKNSHLSHYNIQTDSDLEYDNPKIQSILNSRLEVINSLTSDDDELNEQEEDDDVVPYGFPSARRNNRRPRDCSNNKNADAIGSVMGALEERNSLLRGGNSNSDLSTNLCEIDDAEFELNGSKIVASL